MLQEQQTMDNNGFVGMLKWFVAMSLLLNFVTAFLLFGGVRTNPADVKKQLAEAVQQAESHSLEIARKLDKVSETATSIQSALRERNSLLTDILDQLPATARDRIYRAEIEQLVRDLKELNPDLKIPDIPRLVEAVSDPPVIEIKKD
jgi:hypothetical protein